MGAAGGWVSHPAAGLLVVVPTRRFFSASKTVKSATLTPAPAERLLPVLALRFFRTYRCRTER